MYYFKIYIFKHKPLGVSNIMESNVNLSRTCGLFSSAISKTPILSTLLYKAICLWIHDILMHFNASLYTLHAT